MTVRRGAAAAAIGALCLGLAGLFPAAPARAAGSEEVAGALAALQHEDARLQSVGWRLATANARYCRHTEPRVGLLLQDVMNYDDPESVRAAAGLAGDIAVQAVAEGSPAALAGLVPNSEIVTINGERAALQPATPGDYERLLRLHRRIESALAADGRVAIGLRSRQGETRTVVLDGVPACVSRFEVMSGSGAQADGERVQVGFRFGGGERPLSNGGEDDYAAIVAHELAHNLLGHKALLDRIGRDWPKVRRTEREADRLSVWLLANAGFDPEAAPRLRANRGREDLFGFLREPTHDGWRTRVSAMTDEVARMRQVLAAHGAADWSRHFVREPGVDPALAGGAQAPNYLTSGGK